MDSLTLTLDGAIDSRDWTVSGHAMRWMPPEQAAVIREERADVTEEPPRFGDDRGCALLGG